MANTSKSAPVTSSAPPAPEPCGWGFTYTGPKTPSKVRGCLQCLSAQEGHCLNHAGPSPDCGLCEAARVGMCPSHGVGIARALDDYGKSLSGRPAASFAAVRQLVDTELAAMPDNAMVRIEIGASVGAHVDATGTATGVPPRTLDVKVLQLPG